MSDRTVYNVCPVIGVRGEGFYSGHTVLVNGQPVYYRKYDGKDFQEVADEFAVTLGKLVGKELAYPEQMPEDER